MRGYILRILCKSDPTNDDGSPLQTFLHKDLDKKEPREDGVTTW